MTDLARFQTKPGKVFRHGKEIEVETLVSTTKPKKRQPFRSWFAQVPIYWIRQLERHNSAAVYQLAHRILLEDHKRQHLDGGGEIILSTEVTGLNRQTRSKAIKIMVKAKMIRISQSGNQAVRVVELLHMHTRHL
jgi:hypothetical protein